MFGGLSFTAPNISIAPTSAETSTPMHSFAVSERSIVHFMGDNGAEGADQKSAGIEERFSKESTFYSDTAVKRTVIEMHQVFEECRQHVAQHGKLSVEETLAFSLRYRSVLHSAAVNRDTQEARNDFIAWSLFESLFFSPSNSVLALDLIRWAVTSFMHAQSVLSDVVREAEEQGRSVDETSGYWKAVVLQLTSFRFDMCARLLADNSCQDEATEAFVAVLRRMDIQWLLDKDEISPYTTWQKVVRDLIASGVFDSNQNILFLAGAITGDTRVYSRLSEVILDEWWHLVPLYLVTYHTGVEIDQLTEITDRCRLMFPEKEEHDVFVHLFQLDSLAVLQEMCEPAYLAAHLCDLLHVCGGSAITKEAIAAAHDVKGSEKSGGGEGAFDLRSYLLADYGNTLMAHSDLWELGADYLCEIGPEGRAQIEQHLIALHIDGERVANKVWRLVKREKLDEAARMVVNTMTNRYVRQGCWAAALGWALRGDGKRGQALDTACQAILFKANSEEVTRLSVLEHVGDVVLVQSSGLLLLYSYYQFNRLLRNGELVPAVEKLVSLLRQSGVPGQFRTKLFEHVLEILGTGDAIVLEKRLVYELMSLVSRFQLDLKATKEEEQQVVSDAQLVMLRSLLAKALAKSIVKFK